MQLEELDMNLSLLFLESTRCSIFFIYDIAPLYIIFPLVLVLGAELSYVPVCLLLSLSLSQGQGRNSFSAYYSQKPLSIQNLNIINILKRMNLVVYCFWVK